MKAAATDAGLSWTLERSVFAPEHFGNGEVVLRSGPVLVRIVRDRGQYFVDLAPLSHPLEFHSADDVEVAFGWRSEGNVRAKVRPEPPEVVLGRFAARFAEVAEAFDEGRVTSTIASVAAVRDQRGNAFMARLKELSARRR